MAGAGAAVGAISVGVAVVQNLRKPNTSVNNNDTDADNERSRNTDNNGNDDDDDNGRRVSDDNNGDDNGGDEDNRKTSDESRDIRSDEDPKDRYYREQRERAEDRLAIKIKKPLESTKLELSPEDFEQITQMLRQNKKDFKIL